MVRACRFHKDDDDYYTNRKNKGKQRVQDDKLAIIVTKDNMAREETG